MTWIKSCNIFDWFILACSSMFRIPFIFRAEQSSAIVLLHFVDSFFCESLSFFHSLVLDNPGLDLSIGISLQDSAFKVFRISTLQWDCWIFHHSMISSSRNCHTVFFSGWIVSHCHQKGECTRVPIFLYPHQKWGDISLWL